MQISKINGINFTSTDKKDKKPSGTWPALGVQAGVGVAGSAAAIFSSKLFNKFQENLSEVQTNGIHQKLQQAIIDRGLEEKVLLELVPEQDFSYLGKFVQKIVEAFNPGIAIASGKNAYCTYLKDGRQIISLPEKKLALSGFHEFGHAKNYQNFIGKLITRLQINKFLPSLVGYGVLTALFTRRRVPEDGQTLSKTDKCINFLKDNAGKLVLLTASPMLLSEAAANITGYNIAKKYITKDLLKMYTKSSLAGFASYASVATAAVLAIHLAVKTKDHFAGTTPVKK